MEYDISLVDEKTFEYDIDIQDEDIVQYDEVEDIFDSQNQFSNQTPKIPNHYLPPLPEKKQKKP